MGEVADGVGTTIEFETSALVLRMVRITPPPISGGDKMDHTALGNKAWKTAAPRTLKELGEGSFEAFFDTSKWASAPVNINQEIKIVYPDGTYHSFWGYLGSFEPGEVVEGDYAKCTGTLVGTNLNGSDVEVGPSYGTATSITST